MRCDSPVVLSLGVEDVRRRRWSSWKGWPDEIQVSVGFNAKICARAFLIHQVFKANFDEHVDLSHLLEKKWLVVDVA